MVKIDRKGRNILIIPLLGESHTPKSPREHDNCTSRYKIEDTIGKVDVAPKAGRRESARRLGHREKRRLNLLTLLIHLSFTRKLYLI